MKKNLLLSLIFVFAFAVQTLAQEKRITGTVTDKVTGKGLPGVTVTVIGTSVVTSTNIFGEYAISIPSEDAILLFRAMGYLAVERVVGNAATVGVSLSVDPKTLGEIVVTGYGTQVKKEFTGAAAVVPADKLENRPIVSVDQLLQGQVAGLQSVTLSGQPGANQQVRIRGIGSINAGSNPLYVVDGVIINAGEASRLTVTSNQLAGLNPNDIESVTVLKDAASTSIYGSRGANGVIVITTKKGAAGKTVFNATAEYGVTSVAKRPEAGEVLTAEEWLALTKEGLVNAGKTQAVVNSYMTAFGEGSGVDTDWYDVVTRAGAQQTYNLSASGGSDKTQFYLSGGLFKQEAPIIGSEFTRISGTLNLNHKVSEKISFYNTLQIANVNQDTPENGGGYANPVGAVGFLLPTQNPYNEDGTLNISRAGALGFSGNYNPLYTVENDVRELRNMKMIGSLGGSWNVLDNLKYSSRLGIDYFNIEEEMFLNPFHSDGRSVSGRGYNYYTRVFNWIATNQLDYHFKIPGVERFTADATVGYEAQKSRTYNISTEATGYPPTTALPASIVAATPVAANATGSDYSFASLFSRLSVNFADKYILSGSFRRDGSSRFGSNNRYGNFWSVGASWNVDEEAFMRNIDPVSTLKLRASYGVNGNAATSSAFGNYTWRPTFGFGANYNQQPGGAFNNIGNTDLTWEKNKPFDVGVDMGLFSNRLTFSADYYIRTTSSLLLNKQISRTTGFKEIFQNIGEMQNRGFEFSLGGYPIDGAFKWNTNFNIAFNKNKLTSLPGGADILDSPYLLREGYDYRTFYVRQWAGVDPVTGAPQWWKDAEKTTKTSSWSGAAPVPYESATPKAFGGFNNTISYKGLTLDALVVFNFGNYIRDGWEVYMIDGWFPLANKYRKNLDRWQKEGDVTDVPKYVYNDPSNSNMFSTRFLYKGDFLRLRNISLGYDLNPAWVKKAGFSRVNVYVRGTNLATRIFDEDLPVDPEAGVNSSNNADIPIGRAVTFGLNVNF